MNLNADGTANANTNTKTNASFKAISEIHMFIDFNCAANFEEGPSINENEEGGRHTKEDPTLIFVLWETHFTSMRLLCEMLLMCPDTWSRCGPSSLGNLST